MKSFDRHLTVRRAEVFAETKQSVMSGEHFDRAGVTLGDLDLQRERVRFHVNAPLDGEMFVAKFLCARDVQEGVRLAIERLDLRFTHSVAFPIGILSTKR